MATHFTTSLTVGLRRRWKAGLTHAFGLAGAIWLVTEIVTRLSKSANDWLTEHGDSFGVAVLLACVVAFLWYAYEHRKVEFQVPTTNSFITIKFGDLFAEDSDWLLGVNEFFDGRLGHVVAQSSVHGQFIARAFNGDEARFRDAVTNALVGVPATKTDRADNPEDAYPIGTTAVVPLGSKKAYLVAIAKTDLQTNKASATVPMLWEAIIGALGTIQDYGNGERLAMPLIGNGRSSVNIEPQHLLRLLTLALVEFGRKVGLPASVTIVVPEACFEQLDLREIKRDWMKA